MALSNLQIENFLRRYTTNFQGVFSCDNIPKKVERVTNFSIVLNLSKENELGTHFITVLKFPTEIWYIDSLGLWCENHHILKFLNLFKTKIYFNKRQLQSLTSNKCGFYCILFCLHFDHPSDLKLSFTSV